MNDILSMSYWRFIALLQLSEQQNKGAKGEPVVQQGLYQSQKDMIAKAKEFEEKQRMKKHGKMV